MEKVIDILDGKEKDIDKLNFLKKTSDNFILSIPHGGTLIPTKFRDKLNIKDSLPVESDLFTEEVYDVNGGVKISTKLCSSFVNMNRNKNKKRDSSLPLHLQRGVLQGLYSDGDKVLKQEYNESEEQEALLYYNEYHDLIEKSIKEMKEKYGYALLFDCHSLNPIGSRNTPDKDNKRADFVIGTLDDRSAHSEIISVFSETLNRESEKAGLTVEKNNPYKGGFITIKYNKPSENIHVIQLEVNKKNYLDEGFKLNMEGLKRVNSIIAKAIEAASQKAKEIL